MSSKNIITRRRFFEKTVASGLILGAGSFLATSCGYNKKPNILLIMSDEHNAKVLGCYGNRIIQTPNLDALARNGVIFDNCYCNSPLCVPSRLSFTAGKYPSRVNVWSNSSWLPSEDYPTIARIMNTAGYESFLYGKMHFDKTRSYGFNRILPELDSWYFKVWFKNGKGSRRKPDDLTPKPGLSDRFNDFHPGESPITINDRKVTKGTVKFLQSRKVTDKPFFYIAGYVAPHFPLIVPQEYRDRYTNKVPMPVIPAGHLESQSLNYKHLRISFNCEDVPGNIVKNGRELYYGLTNWLDDEIGKVLEALKDSEVSDNTVVIYTTDHGENIGEHGLWWKNCMYEHAARIPLIVSWPARWKGGQRRTEICSLVDVVRTIAELGNAKVPVDWNGDSLLPLLDGSDSLWKNFAVSEYYAHNIASGFVMLRQGDFKYVYHTPPNSDFPAEQELYNLKEDPGEFNNLAGQTEYKQTIETMHAALLLELGEDPDKTELRCREDYAKGYKREEG